MKLVVIGLSVTSSWGNGHATTFRALLKSFRKRGHDIIFLERDVPYYASNRDMPNPEFCTTHLYEDLDELKSKYAQTIAEADAVMVGSYVPGGVEVNDWVFKTAQGVKLFYDIDTPVTMAKIKNEDFEYLHPNQIKHFDVYLSFSGGLILDYIMSFYGVPQALPLYCSVDPDLYYPEELPKKWQMGYLGTYSIDRQATVEKLLNKPAIQRPEFNFVVAGPQYPHDYPWNQNVERIEHLPPKLHRDFYNSQKYTLNVTRKDMIAAGYSPSVRLFEAAACGVPIISDFWNGLDSFFKLGTEILTAESAGEVLHHWSEISEEERQAIGARARERVLKELTSDVRAGELEKYILNVRESVASEELKFNEI